ncbi:unnamed protein product, partial [Brassica oleracea]
MMIYRNQALKMNLDHLLSSSCTVLKTFLSTMGTWLMLAEYVSLCGRTCQKR